MALNKAQQRMLALEARRAMTEEERRAYSRTICQTLISLPEIRLAKRIMTYSASPYEADLSDLHDFLNRNGQIPAYPVCSDPDGPHGPGFMEAFQPKSEQTPFLEGAYGIKVPDLQDCIILLPEELDLVLVPLVAFSVNGARLGHGAGYYDRYLARCPQAKRIAVAFDEQELPAVATDKFDVPMDLIVTQSRVLRF